MNHQSLFMPMAPNHESIYVAMTVTGCLPLLPSVLQTSKIHDIQTAQFIKPFISTNPISQYSTCSGCEKWLMMYIYPGRHRYRQRTEAEIVRAEWINARLFSSPNCGFAPLSGVPLLVHAKDKQNPIKHGSGSPLNGASCCSAVCTSAW